MNELSKQEVIAAIQRKRPPRIPMHYMHYYSPATEQKYAEGIERLRRAYPEDVVRADYPWPNWWMLESE